MERWNAGRKICFRTPKVFSRVRLCYQVWEVYGTLERESDMYGWMDMADSPHPEGGRPRSGHNEADSRQVFSEKRHQIWYKKG
ncbi:MAG: hypothetical protein ABL959_07930, partial [Pyrinomonadaceae bacterium]